MARIWWYGLTKFSWIFDNDSASYISEGIFVASVPAHTGTVGVLSYIAKSVSYTIYTPNKTSSIYGFSYVPMSVNHSETLIIDTDLSLLFNSTQNSTLH